MYMEEKLHKMKLAAGMRLWLCILFRLLKINAGGKSVVFSMCRKCSKKPDVATYAEKIKYSLKIAETIPAVSPIAMGAKKLLKLYSV